MGNKGKKRRLTQKKLGLDLGERKVEQANNIKDKGTSFKRKERGSPASF